MKLKQIININLKHVAIFALLLGVLTVVKAPDAFAATKTWVGTTVNGAWELTGRLQALLSMGTI